jgi:hypothetical protein
VDDGLLAGLVPQDFQAEGGEQAGLESWRQGRQDVAQGRELVEQSGVERAGGGLGDLFAFVVQVGEAGADAGAHGGGCGVGRVGGELFEFEDLGVLRGLDPHRVLVRARDVMIVRQGAAGRRGRAADVRRLSSLAARGTGGRGSGRAAGVL